MRRLAHSLLVSTFLFTLLFAGTTKEDASSAARQFGSALTSGDASRLRPLLPKRGKVRVALTHIAETQGSYGSGQVEAIFREALGRSSVRSFEASRLESDGSSFALVTCRASVVDRQGRTAKVALHLSLQPEDGAWVVREIRESPE